MRYFHTALSVQNMERSRAFYESVFKLTFRVGAERKELGVRFINLQDDHESVIELFQHDDPLPLDTNLVDFRRIGIKHLRSWLRILNRSSMQRWIMEDR
jgi:catechol 2,3-dioxygenase-like lactoylglutathione lyase family enzyme